MADEVPMRAVRGQLVVTWPSMLAHLWWATALCVTCVIEPIVPVAAIVCATFLMARSDRS